MPLPEEGRAEIIGRISNGSVGKGADELGERLDNVMPLMEEMLTRHGYL